MMAIAMFYFAFFGALTAGNTNCLSLFFFDKMLEVIRNVLVTEK
jgi:hypothetical protein